MTTLCSGTRTYSGALSALAALPLLFTSLQAKAERLVNLNFEQEVLIDAQGEMGIESVFRTELGSAWGLPSAITLGLETIHQSELAPTSGLEVSSLLAGPVAEWTGDRVWGSLGVLTQLGVYERSNSLHWVGTGHTHTQLRLTFGFRLGE